MARIFGAIRLYFIFSLSIFLLSVSTTGQQPSPSSDQSTIRGTVIDASGNPAGGASVIADQMSHIVAQTSTDRLGGFVFEGLHAGEYAVRAEKAGSHSDAADVEVSEQQRSAVVVKLILRTPDQDATADDGMVFADKPNFTVAGITDWTAVGGHGSDASLRTSEALARETASLKPSGPNGAGSAAAGTSGTEASLRAVLAAFPQSFDANHTMGEFCFREGDYREAIPPLATAYRIDPENRGNEYDLALAYKEAGDFGHARQHVQNLLAHEDTADLHRVVGEIDEAQGDSVAAEHEYERAVKLDPSEQNYFTWGSELLLHRAVWPAAEVFRTGSEAHPKSARMLAALGAALFASAKYDDAASRLCEASDLNPADPAPYVFLGKIDMAAPAPLDCVEPKLKRFAEQQSGDARANYYYAMAIWKRHQGTENAKEMQRVEALLMKAAADEPKYGEAYLQLGNLYVDERDFDKAINYYNKATEANPQLSEAHYRLGVAYERSGDSAKAKREFQLHDEIEKAQAAAVERQRQEVRQFMVVLQGGPPSH